MPRKKKGDGEVVPFVKPAKIGEATTVLQALNTAVSYNKEYRAVVVVGVLEGSDRCQVTWSAGASKAELVGLLHAVMRNIWDSP